MLPAACFLTLAVVTAALGDDPRSGEAHVDDEATLLSTHVDDEAGLLLLRQRTFDHGARALEEDRERLANTNDGQASLSDSDDVSLPKTGDAQALEEAEAKVRVLPTRCPAGMPEHDPYWAQEARIDSHHDLDRCDHKTCTKPFSNGKRLSTLRELIKATDILMRKQEVNYTLVSGSLLGQARCGDVIPWDGDADIQVLDTDRDKLDALFEGPPNQDETAQLDPDSPTSGTLGDRTVALDFIGYPTFTLVSAWKCLPWRLVDIVTGFYVDIFSPATVPPVVGWSAMSRRPIFSGRQPCDVRGLYASWLEAGFHWQHCESWNHCDDTPMYVIWPSKRCKFAHFEVNCPADTMAYLESIYPLPGGYLEPDVPTRSVA